MRYLAKQLALATGRSVEEVVYEARAWVDRENVR